MAGDSEFCVGPSAPDLRHLSSISALLTCELQLDSCVVDQEEIGTTYTRLVQVRKMGLVTWPFQGASFCNCVGSWWCGCSPFFIGFLSWRHQSWAEVSCCYWRRLSFLWCKLCSRAHLTKVVSFTTINFSKCLGAHLKNPDVNRIFLFSSQNAAFLGSSLLLIFCRKGKLFRPLLQILEANSCHPWY